MPTNYYWYFITALIPMLVGSIWYGPLFGKSWMKTNGFTEESLKGANMAVIFISSYLLSVLLSFMVGNIAIHQIGVYGMLMDSNGELGSNQVLFDDLMEKFGQNYRSFGHGIVHGIQITVLLVLPIMAINALFERRGWKYIFIHVGYWLVTLMLISGCLCHFLAWT